MLDDLETWQLVIVVAQAALVVLVYLRHLFFSSEMKKAPLLTKASPRFSAEPAPLVSIMVPAKDEEESIERCLTSLRSQDYPNFEILVVDDRSDDRTAEIVQAISDRDDRVRLIQIEELPDGWTGKTHALHVCQQHANGDWYLFVDADTEQHSSCVSITMQNAVADNVDFLTLIPALEAQSILEGSAQPFGGTLLWMLQPLSHANNPDELEAGFANGQFILMHKSAYEKLGGHESVRTHFCEDVAFGRAARLLRLNLRIARAPEISTVRMYSSAAQIVKGWSRIFYSVVNADACKIWLLLLAVSLFSVVPYINMPLYGGLWLAGYTSQFVAVMFWLSVVHEIGQFTLYYRVYDSSGTRPAWYQLFRVIGIALMVRVLLKTISLCKTHQVEWRGTSYDASIRD